MSGFETNAQIDAVAALDAAYRDIAVKGGKGVPHAHDVSRALREAGCGETVQVAGLLHDVVEDTACTVGDVCDRFGAAVAALVAAVSEDSAIASYGRRKRALREQIALAGPAAIDIALADKIATLAYVLSSGARLPKRQRAHYEATLAMAPRAAHPALAARVAELLALVAVRDDLSRGGPAARTART